MKGEQAREGVPVDGHGREGAAAVLADRVVVRRVLDPREDRDEVLRRRERQRALLALGHGPEEAGEVPPAPRRARLRQPPHGGLEHGRAVAAHQRRQRGLVRREPAQQARRRRADGRRVPLRERLGQEGAERVRQERRRGLVDGRRAERRERAEARARRPHEDGPVDVEAPRDLVEAARERVHGADRDARAARARGVDRPVVQSEAEAVRAPRQSARLAHRVPVVRRAECGAQRGDVVAPQELRRVARAPREAHREPADGLVVPGGGRHEAGPREAQRLQNGPARRRRDARRVVDVVERVQEQLAADADEPRRRAPVELDRPRRDDRRGLVDDDRFGRRRFPGLPGAGAPQVDRLGVVAHRHAL